MNCHAFWFKAILQKIEGPKPFKYCTSCVPFQLRHLGHSSVDGEAALY